MLWRQSHKFRICATLPTRLFTAHGSKSGENYSNSLRQFGLLVWSARRIILNCGLQSECFIAVQSFSPVERWANKAEHTQSSDHIQNRVAVLSWFLHKIEHKTNKWFIFTWYRSDTSFRLALCAGASGTAGDRITCFPSISVFGSLKCGLARLYLLNTKNISGMGRSISLRSQYGS